MPDHWTYWDNLMKRLGDPGRVAEELTDRQVLDLLTEQRDRHRQAERDILRHEAEERFGPDQPAGF